MSAVPRARRKVTRLRLAMTQSRVSLMDLADATGYAKTTVDDYVSGRTRRGTVECRDALVVAAGALGVEVEGDPWERIPVAEAGPQRSSRRTRPAGFAMSASSHTTPNEPESREGEADEEAPDVIPTKIYLDPNEWTHFGLQSDPWDELPLVDCWASPRTNYIQLAIARAIVHRQIVAVVGEVGSGKTTTLRTMHDHLSIEVPSVRWITPGNLDRDEISEGSLAMAILRDLGKGDLGGISAEKRGEMLRTELERRAGEGEYPTLVIDEAHDLSITGLIAIKRVWDSFTFNRSLGVVLAGWTDLKETLQSDYRARELAGRTRILEIPPMTPTETRGYMQHRIQMAGGELDKVFEPEAVQMVHTRGGVAPLWIDALAANAMQHAHNTGARLVTARVVARA